MNTVLMFVKHLLPSILLVLFLLGCETEDSLNEADTTDIEDPELTTAHDRFWENLSQYCGRAFRGSLTLEPEGDEMLEGDEELVVHFRQCDEEELRLPFHIEEDDDQWDRSRTWVFMRHDDALELRHDHRHEDGIEEDNTWYGGSTQDEGTAYRQQFLYEERTAEDGSPLGWRVEIEPGERYTYGTISGEEWTWRVDFDLTDEVDLPPAPWGHEDTEAFGE